MIRSSDFLSRWKSRYVFYIIFLTSVLDVEEGVHPIKICPRYYIMIRVARFEMCMLFLLFLKIVELIARSFHWQFGNVVRTYIPLYAAVIEMSVVDMAGFQYEIRKHIEIALLAIQIYGLRPDLVQRRGVVDTLERYYNSGSSPWQHRLLTLLHVVIK